MELCGFKRHIALKWLKTTTDSSYHYLLNEKESLGECLKSLLDSDFNKTRFQKSLQELNRIHLCKFRNLEETNCCVIEKNNK